MRIYRSHLRMFLFGIVGLVLIVAAVDVMFGHWLSEPPENNEGVLTTRGQAQQRGDIVWGAAMIGTGTLLVGGAFFDLVRRKPVCEVGSTSLNLAIGGGEHTVEIPWTNVRDLYATSMIDEYDGTTREKLVVSVVDPSALPAEFVGADWDGSDLLVDAHDWTKSVDDVVRAGQASLTHSRRMAQLRETELPSLTWETSVVESEADEAGMEIPESEATATSLQAPDEHEQVTDDGALLTFAASQTAESGEAASEEQLDDALADVAGDDSPIGEPDDGEDELA
ncbi:MAG: hypothetical protein ACR2N2_01430 [Acidimicrobiia bacterium]